MMTPFRSRRRIMTARQGKSGFPKSADPVHDAVSPPKPSEGTRRVIMTVVDFSQGGPPCQQ